MKVIFLTVTRLVARRKRIEEPDNQDRWVVSYADLLTLLLAFFVVMYSISSVNEGRYRAVSEAMVKAFQPSEKTSRNDDGASRRGSSSPRRNGSVPMKGMADDIRKVLDPLVNAGQVRVTESARGITVEINASVLFASGQAELDEGSAKSLESLGRVLARAPNAIQVEGHTDNSPISNPVFPSNWELSAARASRVVRLFAQVGVAPDRLSAVGFGEYQNVDSNERPEGRNRNRRVTILILPLEEAATNSP